MKREKWTPKSSRKTLIDNTLMKFRGIQLKVFVVTFLRVGVEVN